MNILRPALRFANGILAPFGFALERVELDFDHRLQSDRHLSRMFAELAAAADAWLSSQRLFECRRRFDMQQEIAGFYADFLKTPFRDQRGGSRFNNLLWLDLIAKAFQPPAIVDSGTYAGASAWALSRGAPSAAVYSFDMDQSHLRWRAPGVRYVQSDWTSFDFAGAASGGLAYFDDHVDQVRRLLQAAERGVSLAIFDDDFPVTSFAPMAHDGKALPKIEFAIDDLLCDGEEIRWISRGLERSWRVDRAYLNRGRALIAATDRLPDTSRITGIHQTPYRVVSIRT